MNSKDILAGFLADSAFAEICSFEKFGRECASSLSPEMASQLYSLLSEQHARTVKEVQQNVNDGKYLPESHEFDRTVLESENNGLQSETSIPYLIKCLTEAVESGNAQADFVDQQILVQLSEAMCRKAGLRKLVDDFMAPATCPDESVCASISVLAEKCIATLRTEEEEK